MKSLLQLIHRVAMQPHEPWALATVVETTGSTYRKPGARMLIDSSGGTVGVVSGGCLEEEIGGRGCDIIAGAPPALLEFDTRRLYGCHGTVRIFVERIPPAIAGGNVITRLGDALDRRQLCRLRCCYEGPSPGTTVLEPAELVAEQSGAFIHCVPLPLRLLLFGTGPEIEPLRQLAFVLGWDTPHYASPECFPHDLLPDAQTAALVMMHHFGRDLRALDFLLPLRLPYIGLLGPRKRYWQLLQELHAQPAFDPEYLGVVYAPAGLDIGSEAPEEIALSIASEVTAVLAGRTGGHLRNRASAIHRDETTPRLAQVA